MAINSWSYPLNRCYQFNWFDKLFIDDDFENVLTET